MKNYTIQEVADTFRRKPKTIRKWIDEGKTFKVLFKVKDGYLIPEKEVERILAEGEIQNDYP